jgi:hypothetical protein
MDLISTYAEDHQDDDVVLIQRSRVSLPAGVPSTIFSCPNPTAAESSEPNNKIDPVLAAAVWIVMGVMVLLALASGYLVLAKVVCAWPFSR